MSTLLYPFLAIVDLVFSHVIARFLFNWWVPALADREGWLPKWLAWFRRSTHRWMLAGATATFLSTASPKDSTFTG